MVRRERRNAREDLSVFGVLFFLSIFSFPEQSGRSEARRDGDGDELDATATATSSTRRRRRRALRSVRFVRSVRSVRSTSANSPYGPRVSCAVVVPTALRTSNAPPGAPARLVRFGPMEVERARRDAPESARQTYPTPRDEPRRGIKRSSERLREAISRPPRVGSRDGFVGLSETRLLTAARAPPPPSPPAAAGT